ncbi:RNA-guided endonuclease TnpB family protein [Persephonella sp. KM09-Lau-8]|uniref:RNA-guided endonuclease InsQ/TnpB family protein n=1 Tax=Persephonella sp. KM09-Lau-8 TaxID=1158345 RepID=UPI000498274B|nr:RNA-guided endonuclease TnpB family protein [Persephonella sp. KM09-Lau-8]
MPIRAYKHKHSINKGKIQTIKQILAEYRKTAKKIAKKQWNIFFKEGSFNKNADIKDIPSNLSERYKQTCQYQVVSVLNSYISNRQNDFVEIVKSSSLDEDTKFILLTINKTKSWFNEKLKEAKLKDKKTGKIIKKLPIEKHHYKLARKIVKQTFKKNRLPSFKHISMQLDQKVAKIEKKKEGKAKEFDYWIKLSTLEKGKPIYLPVYKNSYFENKEGKQLNFVQINEKEENVEIVFLKDLPKETNYIPQTEKISIDIGLKALFAVNTGDLFGRQFYKFLKHYDKIITNLQANLQKQGIRPSQSSRYKELNRKLKEYIKNEINRLLNKIFKLYQPKEIVIENLNFQNSELSPQLNRLLNRFGIKIIKQKLKDLEERFGIKITYVNPAYTSQTCSSCGYVDKRNRKTQEKFECLMCGRKINADVNASRNIGVRSSNPMIYKKRRTVLRMLIRAYLSDARFNACDSRACEVILSNRYFIGYSEPLRIASKEKS